MLKYQYLTYVFLNFKEALKFRSQVLTVHVIVRVPTLPCPPDTSLGAVTGNVAGVFIVTGITKAIIAPLSDIPMVYTRYLTKHKVQMHTGTIRQLCLVVCM